jgi:hypothetical protein
VLLGLVTALIVARPLVLGEDPGLGSRLTDGSSFVLSALWLLAAVGWAGWRVWARHTAWYGGLIEAGLLAIVVITFSSATWVAAYRHPAFLIAWEWLILLVLFSVVRQLGRTPADNRRLLAAVFASGVSLSAYAIYQYAVEMPDVRAYRAQELTPLLQHLEEQGVSLAEYDPRLAAETKRIHENNVYATFAHPNAFAGYLVLLAPAVIGAYAVGRRVSAVAWRKWALLAAGLLVITGLILTRSRGAILGLLLAAGLLFAAWVARREMRGRAIWAAVLVAGFAGCWLFSQTEAGHRALESARQSYEKRRDYWSATWKMITDGKYPRFFWLGVGPGNFSRYYPRYMEEAAHEHITDPHNFALEMWATTGLIGLLALAATLVVLFVKLIRAGATDAEVPDSKSNNEASGATHWEFYLGGMAGLILGFLLSTLPPGGRQASKDEFLLYGVVAGGRAVIWFAAFALFEIVPWKTSTLRLAVMSGLVAFMVNLCVSGGLTMPSVSQTFWLMAALACNTLAQRPAVTARHWLGIVAPLPILAAVCLYYVVAVYVPVSQSLAALNAASQNYGTWAGRYDRDWELIRKEGADPDQRRAVVNRNIQFVDRVILPRLQQSHKHDPRNVVPIIDLALWYGEKWKLAPDTKTRDMAIGLAQFAAGLDPEGREGYLAQYRLNLLFANLSPAPNREFFTRAADAMAQVVRRDPTEARLRYQWAEVLFNAGHTAEARLQAEEAMRLHDLSSEPTRQLTKAQIDQIHRWRKRIS